MTEKDDTTPAEPPKPPQPEPEPSKAEPPAPDRTIVREIDLTDEPTKIFVVETEYEVES
jgi:hypothetical protein